MTAVCVTMFEPIWLFITGASKELTFLFFPRINFPSETRILLFYWTVPVLIFNFMSLGNI